MRHKIISEPRVLVIGNVGIDHYLQTKERHLGGASFNLAWHLHHLMPGRVDFVARIGKDPAGNYIQEALRSHGFPTQYIVQDPNHPTSVVSIMLSEKGIPHYRKPVQLLAAAFLSPEDFGLVDMSQYTLLTFDSNLMTQTRRRQTLFDLLTTNSNIPVFWDMNYRGGEWDTDVLSSILNRTNYLKINHEELALLTTSILPVAAAGTLAQQLTTIANYFASIKMIALTEGEKGAHLWHDGRVIFKPSTPITAADTVGAGDAFSAMMIVGILNRWESTQILKKATDFAGAICQIHGAVPMDAGFYRDRANPI